MRFGFRRPSLHRRIAARISWRRYVRHSLGIKAPRGWGWLTNPERAAYTRGHLHQLLSNPLYAGQIAHKGVIHPGRHPAIIDPETFDAVQRRLADNATSRRSEKNAAEPSLLTGLVFDETGDRLCPTHTNKKGRRYRYYISKRLMHSADSATDGWRLPAGELETNVLQAMQDFLKSETQLVDALKLGGLRPDQLRGLLTDAKKAADELGNAMSDNQQQLVSNLLHRIELRTGSMHIEITRSALVDLFTDQDLDAAAGTEDTFKYVVPVQLKRRGVEAKLVMLAVGDRPSLPDINLVRILANAHRWINDLAHGRAASVRGLARSNKGDVSEMSRILPLAFLAPTIMSVVLEGRQSTALTAHRLKRATLPIRWVDQCRSFGF